MDADQLGLLRPHFRIRRRLGLPEDLLVLDLRAFDRIETGDPTAVRLFVSGPNAKAEGEATPEGFVVFSGSTARAAEVPSATSFVTGLRTQLLAEGVIAGDGPSLRFTRDHLFSSPSAAASL